MANLLDEIEADTAPFTQEVLGYFPYWPRIRKALLAAQTSAALVQVAVTKCPFCHGTLRVEFEEGVTVEHATPIRAPAISQLNIKELIRMWEYASRLEQKLTQLVNFHGDKE
jgi:hypothetical protein